MSGFHSDMNGPLRPWSHVPHRATPFLLHPCPPHQDASTAVLLLRIRRHSTSGRIFANSIGEFWYSCLRLYQVPAVQPALCLETVRPKLDFPPARNKEECGFLSTPTVTYFAHTPIQWGAPGAECWRP